MKFRTSAIITVCVFLLTLTFAGCAFSFDSARLEITKQIKVQLNENPDFESMKFNNYVVDVVVKNPTKTNPEENYGHLYSDQSLEFLSDGGKILSLDQGNKQCTLVAYSQPWFTDGEDNEWYGFYPWFGHQADEGFAYAITSPDALDLKVISCDIAGESAFGPIPYSYPSVSDMKYYSHIKLNVDGQDNLTSIEWKMQDKETGDTAVERTENGCNLSSLVRVVVHIADKNYYDTDVINIIVAEGYGVNDSLEKTVELDKAIPLDKIREIRVVYKMGLESESDASILYEWTYYPEKVMTRADTNVSYRFDMDKNFYSNMVLKERQVLLDVAKYIPESKKESEYTETCDVVFDRDIKFSAFHSDDAFVLKQGDSTEFSQNSCSSKDIGAVYFYSQFVDGKTYNVTSPDFKDGGIMTTDEKDYTILPILPYDEFGSVPSIEISSEEGILKGISWSMVNEKGDIVDSNTTPIDNLSEMRVSVKSGDPRVRYRIRPFYSFKNEDRLKLYVDFSKSTAYNRIYKQEIRETSNPMELLSGEDSEPYISLDDINSIRAKVAMKDEKGNTQFYSFQFFIKPGTVIFDDELGLGLEEVIVPEVNFPDEDGIDFIDSSKVDMSQSNFKQEENVTGENIEKVLNGVKFDLPYGGPNINEDIALPLQIKFKVTSADTGSETWNVIKTGDLQTVLSKVHVFKVLDESSEPVDLVSQVPASDYSKFFNCEVQEEALFITANLMIIDSNESKLKPVTDSDYSHFRVWDGKKNNSFADPILTAEVKESADTPTGTGGSGGGGGCNISALPAIAVLLAVPFMFLSKIRK